MTGRATSEPAGTPVDPASPLTLRRASLGRDARGRVALLLSLAVLSAAIAAAVPPVPQDPRYHAFADTRVIGGVPNFWNVVSNAGFILVGAVGLGWLVRHGRPAPARPLTSGAEFLEAAILLVAVLSTGVGSAYYHLAPDNARLLWDRLPMTVVFMSLFAFVIGDRVDARAGRLLLVPLLLAGGASVVSWHVGELAGHGDLRFYGLVQFFPMLAVPLILLLFPARFSGAGWLWAALVLYAVAKAFELADAPVFALVDVVSGHTVKHGLAAVATGLILLMLARRRPR